MARWLLLIPFATNCTICVLIYKMLTLKQEIPIPSDVMTIFLKLGLLSVLSVIIVGYYSWQAWMNDC